MDEWKTPDISDEFRKRIDRLNKLKSDPIMLANVKAYYKDNPADFINDWVVTYDPRKKPAYIPFILFPRQREFIGWLWDLYRNKEDGLAEKSRDVGFTWLAGAFSVWLWIFHDGVKVGWGSRKQDLVDRLGDPDSIFEKMRMIIRYLPGEFRPEGYSEGDDSNFLKIINRRNGSVIAGEAGDNIGRGGRSSIYFKDESAFYERPERIEAALSQNSDVKIDISTPNGSGNPFYIKRHSGKIKVFTFHWRDDPRKDDAWYQKQVDTLDAVVVAQEIDIDYHASIENICIPNKWIQAAVNFAISDNGAKVIGFDVADEGDDANATVKRHGVVVKDIETWKMGTTTQNSRKVYAEAVAEGYDVINYDSIGVGAGVKGEVTDLVQKNQRNGISISINGISTAESAGDDLIKDQRENDPKRKRKYKDVYLNLRARLWWEMRLRFKRTYEHVNGLEHYPEDDLISIPNNEELISELSQPKYEFSDSGKIKIESKKDMKKRGVKSPNIADALMLSFAPVKQNSLLAAMTGT